MYVGTVSVGTVSLTRKTLGSVGFTYMYVCMYVKFPEDSAVADKTVGSVGATYVRTHTQTHTHAHTHKHIYTHISILDSGGGMPPGPSPPQAQ